jgi:hypothetical protein
VLSERDIKRKLFKEESEAKVKEVLAAKPLYKIKEEEYEDT